MIISIDKSGLCPCNSGYNYLVCCEVFHSNKKSPENAEQLMRSRYSAYVLGNLGNYLFESWHSAFRKNLHASELDKVTLDWQSLAIKDFKAQQNTAQVEFQAFYRENKTIHVLHEISNFVFENDTWFYTDGTIIKSKPPGRNDLCYCQSGKKLKKCCG